MPIDRVRAREILNRYYAQTSSEGSFQIRKNRNMQGESANWWLAGHGAHTSVQDRDKRYLAAYAQMAREAGNHLWSTGLPLDDDYLWYDRAVMATLLKHGCVELRNERFEITESGRLLIENVTSQR
jgi:hypothetical protein